MMTILDLLPPILALIVNAGTQIITCRIKATGLIGSIICGFVLGVATVIGSQLTFAATSSSGDAIGEACANLLIFLCGSYTYFHFLNMGETARRIRLLRELEAAPNGLTLAELSQRYHAREMLERRLGRLCSKGIVTETDGYLRVTRKGVLVVTGIINFLTAVVLGSDYRRSR